MAKRTLITDLDNTLFDWVEIWYASFSAMLAKILEIGDFSEEELKREVRTVHQKRGTSEYAFLLEELPIVREHCGYEDPKKIFADAIDAYRAARSKALQLYPKVRDTLETLKGKEIQVIGFTESMA